MVIEKKTSSKRTKSTPLSSILAKGEFRQEQIASDEVSPSYKIVGPQYVPSLSLYVYQLQVPGGTTDSGVSWSCTGTKGTVVDSSLYGLVAKVFFDSGAAECITLQAEYAIGGTPYTTTLAIYLVQIVVQTATRAAPSAQALFDPESARCTVAPGGSWVCQYIPGSKRNEFKFTGTNGPVELHECLLLDSAGEADQPRSVTIKTSVIMTSPDCNSAAHQHIDVGFIQSAYDSEGWAYYGTQSRLVTLPPNFTFESVDWLSGNKDWPWPWYPNNITSTQTAPAHAQGTGTSPCSIPLYLADGPSLIIPKHYDPTNSSSALLTYAYDVFFAEVYMAARTRESVKYNPNAFDSRDPNQLYFQQAWTDWYAAFQYPNTSAPIVTLGPDWQTSPGTPFAINVDAVPANIIHENPYLNWVPQ